MSEEKLEDLRLAESGLWARRCRVQRCDREIVDGSAAVGRRREGSKDAAGATGSRSRRSTATCCSLSGLPGAWPSGQPPPANIPPIQHHTHRARVASKEAPTFAKKHPDPGKLLCDKGSQLGGGPDGVVGPDQMAAVKTGSLKEQREHCVWKI